MGNLGDVENMLVSIAINNYNYGSFLTECIDSALNQTYPHLEVIVVDDGSTDDSKQIIESYGDRIISVFKENGGQGSAYNAGFAKTQGDIIIFLDSDDYLYPDTVAKIVQAWIPDTVKVHFRLAMINDDGCMLGGNMPNFLHSGDVTGIIERFGCYGSAPASGNAFSRRVLDRYFPMPEPEWRIAADTYPIFLVPFSGKVVTLEGVGGCYRIHRKKELEGKFVLNNNPSTPSKAVTRSTLSRQLIFEALNAYGLIRSEEFKFEAPAQAKIRLISLRVDAESHPIEKDSLGKCLHIGLVGIWNWPGYPIKAKLIYSFWMLTVALSNQWVAEKAIVWAINVSARPSFLRYFHRCAICKTNVVGV